MLTADEKYISELHLLNKYARQIEERAVLNERGETVLNYAYTDHAMMAQHRILLKETVGRGSYSKVKEAYDYKTMRQVAVKIIDLTRAPKDFQEKFLPRELQIWPRVHHPNIIAMHQCVTRSDKIYMILEYASGGDMLTYIQKLCGPVPDKDCKLWMRQICSALQYLHHNNIIHRDLKLENLLIDSKRNIKLCDFGFCKDLNATSSYMQLSSSSLNTTSSSSMDDCIITDDLSRTYCGSKAYASPEILLGQPYDPKKADVWAMGVIFFIFLTGNMPFKEDKCNQVILNQHKSLKLYWSRNPKISSSVRHLVKSIFTFEWSKRPTITDIANSEWFLTPPSHQVTQPPPPLPQTTSIPPATSSTTTTTTTTTSTASPELLSMQHVEYNLRPRFKKRLDDKTGHQQLLTTRS